MQSVAPGEDCGRKDHLRPINGDFTHMFEIHRDAIANDRLHLADPPVFSIRVLDQRAGFKKHVQMTTFFSTGMP